MCISTKFSHQEFTGNFGILCSGNKPVRARKSLKWFPFPENCKPENSG